MNDVNRQIMQYKTRILQKIALNIEISLSHIGFSVVGYLS